VNSTVLDIRIHLLFEGLMKTPIRLHFTIEDKRLVEEEAEEMLVMSQPYINLML